MFWGLTLVIAEVAFITWANYALVGSYYSLDIFYCLPVMQAARLSAVHALRKTDTQLPLYFAVFTGITWSLAEAMLLPDFPKWAFLLNAFSRSVAFTVIGRVVVKLLKEREYGRKDELTHLDTPAEFFKRFELEQLRSERTGSPYSVMFVNIDRFKDPNDQFGQIKGDEALVVMADVLRKNCRKIDSKARIGSSEFALLLPDTDRRSSEFVLQRVKTDAEQAFNARGWPISVLTGCVTETGRTRGVQDVLHEAERVIYSGVSAKRA
jgi:diguanylate cyclase (GGDEF)-like protein